MPRGCSSSVSADTTAGSSRSIALRQRLHDQVVAVAIDDQRRQQIGFAVHQPVGGRVDVRATRGSAIAALEPRARSSASSAALVAVGRACGA